MLLPAPVTSHAEVTPDLPKLIISEVKIKNDTSGYDEFIEIGNLSSEAVNIHEYSIEYFNTSTPAVSQVPVRSILGTGILPAGQSLVLAKNKTQIPHSYVLPFASLADSGGQLRLVSDAEEVVDSIAWSSSSSAATYPIVHMPSTATTKSITREIIMDSEGAFTYSWQLVSPSPVSYELLPIPVEPPDTSEEYDDPILTEPEVPVEVLPGVEVDVPELQPEPPVIEQSALLPLQIIELLPNPTAPLTDAQDEFVEIYNPNAEPVELSGYRLQAGKTYSHSYTFVNEEIPPFGYLVISSGNTNISLANSIGRARLLDATGEVISEAPEYTNSPEGQSWALINDIWQWTASPTPGAANLLILPLAALKKVPSTQPKTVKPKTTARPSASKAASKANAKVAGAKTMKTPSNKATKEKDVVPVAATGSEPPGPLHPSILYSVGALAFAYAVYEYRYDIGNRWYLLKRYFSARRATRTQVIEE